MSKLEKKNIQKYLTMPALEGDLDGAIKALQEAKVTYSQYDSLYISEEYAGGDGGYNYILLGTRLETDEEQAKRIEEQSLREKEREEYERKQFEALRKKFEP